VQAFVCPLSDTLGLDHWELLLSVSQEASQRKAPDLDHLARSDRSDALATWLASRGVSSAWELAPTFVNAGWRFPPSPN